MFYVSFRSNAIVSMAMTAMLAGVAAVICDVVITLSKSIFEKKRIFCLTARHRKQRKLYADPRRNVY